MYEKLQAIKSLSYSSTSCASVLWKKTWPKAGEQYT